MNDITGTLKPLGDRVVVRQDDKKKAEEHKSGLIIPDSVKEKPLTGVVLSVGPGRRAKDGTVIPVSDHIKVGSRVYFGKYTGVEVVQNDEPVIILHEDEVYGVVEELPVTK